MITTMMERGGTEIIVSEDKRRWEAQRIERPRPRALLSVQRQAAGGRPATVVCQPEPNMLFRIVKADDPDSDAGQLAVIYPRPSYREAEEIASTMAASNQMRDAIRHAMPYIDQLLQPFMRQFTRGRLREPDWYAELKDAYEQSTAHIR